MTYQERISDIINAEWDPRYTKKFNRYLKKAQLRYPEADFDQTIYDPDRLLDTDTIERLVDCHWIDEGRNLLITGNAGTGKSYISNALCICALRQFKSVRYAKTSTMIYELEKADLENEHLDFLRRLAKTDLLVLDDFGLMDLDPDKCRNLFELIDAREAWNIVSAILVIVFVIKSIVDYTQYSTTLNSAPFYVWVLVNALYLLIPAIVVFIIGLVVKKKQQKIRGLSD